MARVNDAPWQSPVDTQQDPHFMEDDPFVKEPLRYALTLSGRDSQGNYSRNMVCVPDEIIQFHIVPFLDVQTLCCKFMLLSSRLRNLSDQNHIWKERFFRVLPFSQHGFIRENPVFWKNCFLSAAAAVHSQQQGHATTLQKLLGQQQQLDEWTINFKDLYRTVLVEGMLSENRLLNSGNYKRDQYSHHITYYYLIDMHPSSQLSPNELRCIEQAFGQNLAPSIEFFRGRTRERGALNDHETKEFYGVYGLVIGVYFVMFQEWMSNDLRAHVLGRKVIHRTNKINHENDVYRGEASDECIDEAMVMEPSMVDETFSSSIQGTTVFTEDRYDQKKNQEVSVAIHGVWSDNKERCGLFTSENVDWNTTVFDLSTLGTKLHDVNYKRLYSVEGEVKMFSCLTAFKYWQMTTYHTTNGEYAPSRMEKREYNVTFDCDTYVRGEASLVHHNNYSTHTGPSNAPHMHYQVIGNAMDSYISFNLLNRGEHIFLAWCQFNNAKKKAFDEYHQPSKISTPEEQNRLLRGYDSNHHHHHYTSNYCQGLNPLDFKLSGIILDRDGIKGHISLEPKQLTTTHHD